MKVEQLLVGSLLFTILTSTSAYAEVEKFGSPSSLGNLSRVGLEVDRAPAALEEEGLTRQEIAKNVAERLSGVPVQLLSKTGALHLTGNPTLHVGVSLLEIGVGSYVYVVSLELRQRVCVERLMSSSRPRLFVTAPTWQARAVGMARKGQLQTLKDQIGAVVDTFAKDLLEAPSTEGE